MPVRSAGGLIVKVYARILDHKDGSYCKGSCKAVGGDKSARDHLWLTAAEVKELLSALEALRLRVNGMHWKGRALVCSTIAF